MRCSHDAEGLLMAYICDVIATYLSKLLRLEFSPITRLAHGHISYTPLYSTLLRVGRLHRNSSCTAASDSISLLLTADRAYSAGLKQMQSVVRLPSVSPHFMFPIPTTAGGSQDDSCYRLQSSNPSLLNITFFKVFESFIE